MPPLSSRSLPINQYSLTDDTPFLCYSIESHGVRVVSSGQPTRLIITHMLSIICKRQKSQKPVYIVWCVMWMETEGGVSSYTFQLLLLLSNKFLVSLSLSTYGNFSLFRTSHPRERYRKTFKRVNTTNKCTYQVQKKTNIKHVYP